MYAPPCSTDAFASPAPAKRSWDDEDGAEEECKTDFLQKVQKTKQRVKSSDPQAIDADKPANQAHIKVLQLSNLQTKALIDDYGLLINLAVDQKPVLQEIRNVARVSGSASAMAHLPPPPSPPNASAIF